MIKYKEFCLNRFYILISFTKLSIYHIGFGLGFSSHGVCEYKNKVYKAFEISTNLSLLNYSMSVWLKFRRNKDITDKCDILCCSTGKEQ